MDGELTMAEYIEREAAVKAFNNFDAGRADAPPFTLLTPEEFAEYLYELPVADAAPVVHGKWMRSDDDWDSLTTIRCSICGEEWCFEMIDDVTLLNYKHCPNCGARMDGDKNG